MASTHSVIGFLLCIILLALIGEIKLTDVTFKELDDMNITCYEQNSCKERRNSGVYQLTKGISCHCESSCSHLGTCCLDSPFRERDRATEVEACRSTIVRSRMGNSLRIPVFSNRNFPESYFIIDKCPSSENADNAFQNLCEDDKNTEGDLMSLVPVTSLLSRLTYKNYFCFRCHEANDDYFFWNIKLTTNIEFDRSLYKDVVPTYDKVNGTWLAPVGRDGELIPVSISMDIPRKISSLPKTCFSTLISKCSKDWPEDEIRQKCGMYMSVIYVFGNYSVESYRNPHCALCNFETLERYACVMIKSHPAAGFAPEKKPFSFTHLLDINRSDGDKVGLIQRCDDTSTWDPFFKKCRRLVCAVPGYIIKDGKCRAP